MTKLEFEGKGVYGILISLRQILRRLTIVSGNTKGDAKVLSMQHILTRIFFYKLLIKLTFGKNFVTTLSVQNKAFKQFVFSLLILKTSQVIFFPVTVRKNQFSSPDTVKR